MDFKKPRNEIYNVGTGKKLKVRKIFRFFFLAREPTKPDIFIIYLLLDTCQRDNTNYAQDLDLMHMFFL